MKKEVETKKYSASTKFSVVLREGALPFCFITDK